MKYFLAISLLGLTACQLPGKLPVVDGVGYPYTVQSSCPDTPVTSAPNRSFQVTCVRYTPPCGSATDAETKPVYKNPPTGFRIQCLPPVPAPPQVCGSPTAKSGFQVKCTAPISVPPQTK